MKVLFYLILFLVSFITLNGQNKTQFTYDLAGNMTKREIIFAKSKSAVAEYDSIPFFTDQLVEREIKIYPNPTYGQLQVEIGNSEGIENCTVTITVMNTGRLVTKKKATFPITNIDISNQPFGIYIMVIEIDGEMTSWRLIKK